MAGEPSPDFQDWELLVNSDSDAVNSPNSNNRNIEEIEADSEGVLRLDYFSLENDNRFAKPVSEQGSVDSDNPSWIDPGYENETRFQTRHTAEFWSDSGSDRSDEHREFDVKNELDVVDNGKNEVVAKEREFEGCEGKNERGFEEIVKGFEDFGEIQSTDKDLSKFWSDSGGDTLVMNEDSVVLAESKNGGDASEEEEEENLSAVTVGERKLGRDEERRKVVWWKVPFELLRYCVFRISPVWTFSMAAAVMGFVILGRRLYKMKRKARSIPLKVTVDDKKVSQFMSRAARLNEAFSVVRRVPIVRPLLPAASGVNSWPVMTLR
ncbi:uncharacterized protein [Euphorbia lathyris]|uniref:uncharacterized protein n=1 Tax=Euphorbia lathyris TaxID=212925 RepID=UPI0033130F5F